MNLIQESCWTNSVRVKEIVGFQAFVSEMLLVYVVSGLKFSCIMSAVLVKILFKK